MCTALQQEANWILHQDEFPDYRMYLILICHTEIIDFRLKSLSFNVHHIQICHAACGVEIDLFRFDLFIISFLLTTNARENLWPVSQDAHWVIPWRMFHVWHSRRPHICTLPYSMLSAEVLLLLLLLQQDAGGLYNEGFLFHIHILPFLGSSLKLTTPTYCSSAFCSAHINT